MAKSNKTNDEMMIIGGQLYLPDSTVQKVAGGIPGESGIVEKIFGVARGLLESLAAGGMMIGPKIVAHLNEIVGHDFDESELPALVEKGCGKRDGRVGGWWDVDPVYVESMKEQARLSGITVEQLISDMMHFAMDNCWWQQFPGAMPDIFRVKPQDKQELEELLGSQFSNGTELVGAIRRFAGADAGIFAEAKP